MNMDLDSSKRILKIFGILCIVIGVLSLLLGYVNISGSNDVEFLSAAGIETAQYEEYAKLLVAAGIGAIATGIFKFLEGIFSILASKQNKYGTAAWFLSIVGIIASVLTSVNNIRTNGFTGSTLISVFSEMAVSIIIFMAAKEVKEAYKAERAA